MNDISKILIATGAILLTLGLLWKWGGRFIPLGKLPGDIAIERENFRFYFPLVTSIILSIVISAVLWIIRRLS